MEEKVKQDKFFQFFAVHEIEAWLLSTPSIFPRSVGKRLEAHSGSPESVNDTQRPSKLLDKIYKQETGRKYKKVTHGSSLFGKLDPEITYGKCPHLKLLLDKMLELAKNSRH